MTMYRINYEFNWSEFFSRSCRAEYVMALMVVALVTGIFCGCVR